MIASVLTLSRADFKALGIKDAYSIHKTVYSLFPKEDDKSRSFLYCDKGGDFNKRQILLLSKTMPEKPEIGEVDSKEIPNAFLQEDYYAFEVLINPVKRDSKTKKIIPIIGKDNLYEWFLQKSATFGFSVLPDTLIIQDTDVMQFEKEKQKEKQKVVFGKALFKGKLNVTDRQLFIKSFEQGLGKGKAFGFGLLQIRPITIASVDA